MKRVYLETSALLRALLEGDDAARKAIDGAETLCASDLTFLEAVRAVIRAKYTKRLDARTSREVLRELAAIERECDLIALDEKVMRRAREELPVEPLRALDAVHLATIRILDEELGDTVVASYGDRVRDNLEALGIPLLPMATQ